MAFLPFRLGKALNYHYKLLTKNFTRIPYSDPNNPDKLYRRCQYIADLIVQQHPDYPDIPSSIWTVEVNFDDNGDVRSCVKPKEEPESMKQACVVLMDWKVRTGWADVDVECEDCLDACKGRIGPDGWKLGSCSSLDDFSGEFEFVRDKQDFVLVSLTFIVERTTGRRDLETLLDSGQLSDCQLVCGKEQFPVHRAILAAQSVMFQAIFLLADMKEEGSGTVETNNIGPDALESLLKYAYTRDLASVDVDLTEVWNAASKYAMFDLMKECERLMLGSITDENALKYLNFAAEHGLRMLKTEAAKIISQESP